jgi:uncharacterized radical SAM superfamily Fe-S cluster-containing enzyme
MNAFSKLYYKTTSMCPFCKSLLPGEVVARDNQVFVTRNCPTHGKVEGLICSDMEWYENLARFDVTPIKPAKSQTARDKGCPEDCGLCPAHRQIAGTVALEISNFCNAACPVCLADNKGTFELSVREVQAIVSDLLKRQQVVDAFTLSGGEPTIHPHLFEIIELLERAGMSRIVINSNGKRIAEDDAFLDEMARHPKVYVCLHIDGANSIATRGVTADTQQKALARLCQWNINVSPLILAVKDVNEHELGTLTLRLLAQSPSVKSVFLSMMASCGTRGSQFPFDPLTRLTIPAALGAMEADTNGLLKKHDFMPLPMPNPMCASIGYFIVDGEEVIPLLRFMAIEQFIDHIKNAHFARAEHELEDFLKDTLDAIYASPAKYENAPRILKAFKNLYTQLFERGIAADQRQKIVEERIKTVFLMQFMDTWSFDAVRLSKCSCQHLLPGNRTVPSCGYYAYHRNLDPRFA